MGMIRSVYFGFDGDHLGHVEYWLWGIFESI